MNHINSRFTTALKLVILLLLLIINFGSIIFVFSSEEFREFLYESLYILVAISVMLLGIIVFGFQEYKNRIRKNEKLLEEVENVHVELEALKSIDVVIVQTSSGLPLFEKQYEQVGVDSLLISGVTSVISAFLTELESDSMFGFETVDRHNLSITSHKGMTSTLITISRMKLPLILLNQIEKTHNAIQKTFYQEFVGHEGGFEPIDPSKMQAVFVESGFKIELLMSDLIIDTSAIKKIQKNEAISRLLWQKLDLFKEDELSRYSNNDNTIKLSGIIAFLSQQGISSGFISSLIFLMYANNGIKIVWKKTKRNIKND